MSNLAERTYSPHLSDTRARTRKVRFSAIALAMALTASIFLSSPVGAANNNSDLQKAKAAVAKAQKEARSAIDKYTKAETALDKVSDKLSDTQKQIEVAEASMAELRAKAQDQAKSAYIRSSAESTSETYEDEVDNQRGDQFLATVSQFDDKQLNKYVGMQEDLTVTKKELANLKEDHKKTLATLEKEKKAFTAKLNKASKAQKALESKIARDAKAAKKRAMSASSSSSSGGGKTGVIVIGGSGLACPVQGAVTFRDTWGDARSAGRTHKGTDMFAASGTPNVAVGNGTVYFQSGGAGGIGAYVTSGRYTYYYAHLRSTVGGNRSVSRGEVIGYTGTTGNAAGGAPHTHFEIRVGGMGGTQINPYSTLRSIC